MLDGERSVKTNLDKTDLFALSGKIVDGLFNGVADRAHGNDNLFGIGSTVVVEELIIGTDLGIDLIHVILGDADDIVIILVAGLTCLEEDVGVLSRAAQNGMLGVERTAAVCVDCVPVKHIGKILVIPDLNFLDFMRSTETVEEMQERNTTLDGGKVSNGAEIHNLLNVA